MKKNAPDFYRNVDSIFERQDLFQTVQKWASHELESRGILETNDRRNWMYMMKRLLTSIILDFRLFDAVKASVPNAVGVFSESHDQVLTAAQAAIPREGNKLDLIVRIEKLSMADFSDLTWKRIFELRRNGFIGDFRKRLSKIAELQSGGRPIEMQVMADLWSLVSDVEPHLKRTYATAVIGNLPLPIPLNPAGIIATMEDIKQARDLKKRYGWLFFIQEVQQPLVRTKSPSA